VRWDISLRATPSLWEGKLGEGKVALKATKLLNRKVVHAGGADTKNASLDGSRKGAR
jgi:hypothetical protein